MKEFECHSNNKKGPRRIILRQKRGAKEAKKGLDKAGESIVAWLLAGTLKGLDDRRRSNEQGERKLRESRTLSDRLHVEARIQLGRKTGKEKAD